MSFEDLSGMHLFENEPDPNKLDTLPKEISFKVYNWSDTLYSLDYWTKDEDDHEYGMVKPEDPVLETLPENDTHVEYKAILDTLKNHTSIVYGVDWLKLSSALGMVLNSPSYFYATDFNQYNLACHTDSSGSLNRITVFLKPFVFRLINNKWLVSPILIEDSVAQWTNELLGEISKLPNTEVGEICTLKDYADLDLWSTFDDYWYPDSWDFPGMYHTLDDNVELIFER